MASARERLVELLSMKRQFPEAQGTDWATVWAIVEACAEVADEAEMYNVPEGEAPRSGDSVRSALADAEKETRG